MTNVQKSRKYMYGALLIILIIVVGSASYYYFAPSRVAPIATTTGATTRAMAFKDTLIIGTTDSLGGPLDGTWGLGFFDSNLVESLGAPLVDIAPGSSPTRLVPSLATDWTVSADGMTYTFNLRQGVKWADGTCCFNATVVKYHFDRGMLLNPPDGAFSYTGLSDLLNYTKVTGPYQIVFHLNHPFAPFLGLLAGSVGYVVTPKYAPMAQVNYTAGDILHSTPMANNLGPYRLTAWSKVGGKDYSFGLDANPYYWNISGGYPKTPHIKITVYSDSTALAVAMKAGDIDVAYRQLLPTDIKNMESDPHLKVWQRQGPFIQYLIFQQAIKPFDDVRVRRAVAASINRRLLTSTVFINQTFPLYSMIPEGMFAHKDAFKVYGDANYTYTRQVLNALGYNENKKLVVDFWYESSGHYPSSSDQAVAIKSALEGSGVIQVNLHGADWPTFRANMRASSQALFQFGQYPDYMDPDNYVFLISKGATNLFDHYDNPQLDALIATAAQTSDPQQRAQLYYQIQQISAADVPTIPLWQGSAFAVSKPDVGGIVLDLTQVFRYSLLYEPVSTQSIIEPPILIAETLSPAVTAFNMPNSRFPTFMP
jgi:peptide/nickel transport system substrate-binding protein